MNFKTILIFFTVVALQACSTKKNTSFESKDIRIHDIWVAIEINGEAVGQRAEMPRLELNLNTMQIFGNNGCNEFSGKIISVGEKNISFGAIAMTKKRCQDMTLPRNFKQALTKAALYKFADLHLVFYDKEGIKLITFLKVD